MTIICPFIWYIFTVCFFCRTQIFFEKTLDKSTGLCYNFNQEIKNNS